MPQFKITQSNVELSGTLNLEQVDSPPAPKRMQICLGGLQEPSHAEEIMQSGWHWGFGVEGPTTQHDIDEWMVHGRPVFISLGDNWRGTEHDISDLPDFVVGVEIEPSSSGRWNESRWKRHADACNRPFYAYKSTWKWQVASEHGNYSTLWYPGYAHYPTDEKVIWADPSFYSAYQLASWRDDYPESQLGCHIQGFGQDWTSGTWAARRRALAPSIFQIWTQLLTCERVGCSWVSFWGTQQYDADTRKMYYTYRDFINLWDRITYTVGVYVNGQIPKSSPGSWGRGEEMFKPFKVER